MDNPGLQPSITPPPAIPPISPPPPVLVEQPQIQIPVKKFIKLKKFLPLGLVMILLVGGLFLGKNLLQEKQRPVEKMAVVPVCNKPGETDCGEAGCCNKTQQCCNSGCKPKGEDCGPDNEPIPSLPSPIPPPTPGAPNTIDCGAQTCWKDTECCTLTGCHPKGSTECGGVKITETKCFSTGCQVSDADWNGGVDSHCVVYSYFCPDRHAGALCGQNQEGPFQQAFFAHDCGIEQIDLICKDLTARFKVSPARPVCGITTTATGGNGEGGCVPTWGACSVSCGTGTQTDGCGNSQACNTQACPSLACVGLTKDKTAPSLGDQVTFTCEASFSSGSPVAYFRRKVNDEDWVTYSPAYPVSSTTHQATYQMPINYVGDWVVQCRVCTDDTKTTCTVWGEAN